MILWNIRHAGSPQSVDGVTAEDILDGVKEGLWETSDEVMGPDDGDWETLIAVAKSRPAPTPARKTATLVRTPPPVRLSAFARDFRPARQDEDRAWEELIARAKRRATNAPAPAVAHPHRRPGHETGDWSAVIAAAKLRHGLHGRV